MTYSEDVQWSSDVSAAGLLRNVSLIIATRNRAYTLSIVAKSWYQQAGLKEVVFVDDAGDDGSCVLIEGFRERYNEVRTIYIKNSTRQGTPSARMIGVAEASQELVAFCDDDEYLEPGYIARCVQRLDESNMGAVSGRRVYMEIGESAQQALRRFGNGVPGRSFFVEAYLDHDSDGYVDTELEMPFTNAIIVTRKALLNTYGFDPFYSKGTCYREETDFQMNLFVNGFKNVMLSDVHSVHLPVQFVKTRRCTITEESRFDSAKNSRLADLL